MLNVPQMNELINSHIKRGSAKFKKWERWHSWYLSEWAVEADATDPVGEDPQSKELNLETNYPYPYIDTMISNVCPTNPMMSVSARDIDEASASSAAAREALINDTFKSDKMHAKAQDMSTFSAITGMGISKTVWHARRKRPTTTILDPKVVGFDTTVKEWEDIRYIFEAVTITESEFKARIRMEGDDPALAKYDPNVAENADYGSYPTWLQDHERGRAMNNEAARAMFKWVTVYEFYDLVDNVFYHLLKDAEEPLYKGALPNRFMRNPFAKLTFNVNLREPVGVSDVKLIEGPQERLNEIDTLELQYAKTCIPVPILDESAFDNPEDGVTQYQKASNPGHIVRWKLKGDRDIRSVVTWNTSPSMSPSHDKMRERCIYIIEFILGLPGYLRGNLAGGDSPATAFALADASLRTRNGRRIKVVEDWLSEVSLKVLAIWKEKLDPEKSIRIRTSADDSILVDRAALAFPSPQDTPEEFEDEALYNFDAVPYSPTENNRLVQLQKLQQFWPVIEKFIGKGVDPTKILRKLLDLLQIGDVKQDQPAQPPPGQPASGPGAPGQPGPQSPDTLNTGGMPTGLDVEPILPPGARALADQPNIGG